MLSQQSKLISLRFDRWSQTRRKLTNTRLKLRRHIYIEGGSAASAINRIDQSLARIKVAPAKSFSLRCCRFYRLSILSTHKDAGWQFQDVFFVRGARVWCVCVRHGIIYRKKGPTWWFYMYGRKQQQKGGSFWDALGCDAIRLSGRLERRARALVCALSLLALFIVTLLPSTNTSFTLAALRK